MPELYLLLSTELVILAASDAYLEATLASREDIVGKYVFEAFPDNPETPDANGVANLLASLQHVLATGKPHEMPVQHYDVRRPAALGGGFETRYWLPLNTPALGDKGEVLYLIHQVTNVTDQVIAHRKGELNEALLKGLALTAPVGLWMTDTAGAITFVNQTWVDWTGKPLREHLERGWSLSILEEDRGQALEQLLKSIRKRIHFRAEFRVLHTDGTIRWCSAEGVPHYLSNNQFGGYVVSCSDISRLKQSEERLHALSAELTVSNSELLSVNRQLTRINSDLDNFIYIASHDLKAPVANIEGLLQLLTYHLFSDSSDTEEAQHVLKLMQDNVMRFKKTIGNLTDITELQKLNSGEAMPVDIPRVVREVLLDLEQQIQKAGTQVETQLGDCKAILFSEKNLRSIVYNLLSNAVKYRVPGRAPLVRVTCRKEQEHVVLEVQDNGLGMSDKQQKELYTMFRRFHDHVEGTGVGLHMVKRIVENAGGRIEVKSTEGEGTTFTVYLKGQIG